MTSATDNPAKASIMATTSTQSPAKMSKNGDHLACFVPNLLHITSQWTQTGQKKIETENREGDEKKETKKRREDEAEQEEEKKIIDPKYYPPEPIYISSHEDQPPTLVKDLILAPENSKDLKHNEGKSKIEEDRRIVLELLDEERDLD